MDRNQLKAALARMLHEVTGESYDSLAEDQSLKEHLNLDSLDLVSMAIEAQSTLGVTIESNEVTNIVTVGDLLTLLESKLKQLPKAA